MTIRPNVDLGKSFEKAFRNPGLIHKIQDSLIELLAQKPMIVFENSKLAILITAYAKTAIVPLIKIIHSEAKKDPSFTKLINRETMKMIDEYMEAEEEPGSDTIKDSEGQLGPGC